MTAGGFEAAREGDRLVLAARGAWTLEAAAGLDRRLAALDPGEARAVRLELGGIEALDTAGAWLIERTRRALARRGLAVELAGAGPEQARLLDRLAEMAPPALPPPARGNPLLARLAEIGERTVEIGVRARDMLGFFGAVVVTLGRTLLRPRRLRLVPLLSHLEQAGFKALPIMGLLSFLVGVVLAYQGVDQLRRFGAEIFTVNLVGISVLREMGILITAIVVAGRSGSAFTAQIGTMQVNEEVDALRTLGLDPMEVLVLPRLIALVIALPLLTFFANIVALLGGGLMLALLIDVTLPQFFAQLREAVTVTTFWVGMVKAPVFAFLIAMVGCFEGLRVTGSAESVGRLTTQSVVESIFLVIVFDAIFSVAFSYLGI